MFGSCQLDLSDAESTPAAGDDGADATIEVTAVAVFGGIEIVVPQGVAVDLGGFAVFGSKSYRVRGDQPPPGAPLVRVSSRAVFGGVTVRTRPFTAGRP